MSRVASHTPRAKPTRVPVTVVSGYLGSGKTTLISSLLSDDHAAGTSVIVNELAGIGIDQTIIGDAGADDVVLLSNGCLCCSAGSDLRQAVARLLNHEANADTPTKRIIIETSGVADPGPIVQQVCFDPVLRNQVRYGGTVTLFDAVHGISMLGQDPVGYRQIGLADRVLITKKDLATDQQCKDAVALVTAANPNTQIAETSSELADYLLNGARGVAETGISAWIGSAGSPYEDAPHEHPLKTWTIVAEGPIDWPRTEQALRLIFDQHGNDVLRTKGVVRTVQDSRPLVVHGIHRQFHRPVFLKKWDVTPNTRFVLIGFDGAEAAARAIAELIGGAVESDLPKQHYTKQLNTNGGAEHVQTIGK